MKFPGPQCRFVKLHRPPPEIRIFRPTCPLCSSSATRRPRCPAVAAHISPAAPAPKTITSNWRSRRHSWLPFRIAAHPSRKPTRGNCPNISTRSGVLKKCCCNNYRSTILRAPFARRMVLRPASEPRLHLALLHLRHLHPRHRNRLAIMPGHNRRRLRLIQIRLAPPPS